MGGIFYGRYLTSTFAYMEPQDREPRDYARILKLLDRMVLTHRTRDSNQLIALVSQAQETPLAEYPQYTAPLIPRLKAVRRIGRSRTGRVLARFGRETASGSPGYPF